MRFTHRPTTTPLLARYCRRTLRRDSPRRRNIGAGTGRTAATSVPGLCFEWPSSHLSARLHCSFVPVRVTQAVRSNIHNPERRVRSIGHTVVDVYRCHHGTATVLRYDWDGRPTVLIRLYLRAVRALRQLVVTCCSSPRMNVWAWDEFTTGTPAANNAYLAFDLPRST